MMLNRPSEVKAEPPSSQTQEDAAWRWEAQAGLSTDAKQSLDVWDGTAGLSAPAELPRTQENVLDFLRNRPQLAGMEKASETSLRSVPSTPNLAGGQEVEDLVSSNASQGNPSSWQHSETVVDFLRRLPVDHPATADVGPWLWVHAQTPQRRWSDQSLKSNAQP